MVWTGILNDSIIGTYCGDGNIMGVMYMNMLETVLFPVLDMPLACYRELWFQQNGVGPHFATVLCLFMMKWIRRGATTE
jgi:hypothetical protein